MKCMKFDSLIEAAAIVKTESPFTGVKVTAGRTGE